MPIVKYVCPYCGERDHTNSNPEFPLRSFPLEMECTKNRRKKFRILEKRDAFGAIIYCQKIEKRRKP